MSHALHRKLMAVTAEALPAGDLSGRDTDAMRKAVTIGIATQLGHRIESRTDLTAQSGALVLDAMEGIKAGTYRWVDDRLIHAATGEVVTAEGMT